MVRKIFNGPCRTFPTTQLRRPVKFATMPAVELYMDELAREMATLKPGDPRRKEIVEEIIRLADSQGVK